MQLASLETRGPKSIHEDKKKLVKMLIEIRDGDRVLTHYMKTELVASGYLSASVPADRPRTRGRPMEVYELTPRARNLINLSRGWR